MKVKLAGWLRAFADWLSPRDGHLLHVPHDDLYQSALLATAGVEARPENAEWKRHQVYAALLKAYPVRSKRDVALAIEAAVSQMGEEQGSERG